MYIYKFSMYIELRGIFLCKLMKIFYIYFDILIKYKVILKIYKRIKFILIYKDLYGFMCIKIYLFDYRYCI